MEEELRPFDEYTSKGDPMGWQRSTALRAYVIIHESILGGTVIYICSVPTYILTYMCLRTLTLN